MAYIAQSDGSGLGAAAVRWTLDDSQIVNIGVLPTARGQGYGVGTANSGWWNIALYQQSGFRMHSVRKDFFE
jgi:hypothetical protein